MRELLARLVSGERDVQVFGLDHPQASIAAGVDHVEWGKIHIDVERDAVVGTAVADAQAEGGEKIPTNWFAATDRFAESAILKDYLGERFVRMYSIVKRVEQDRFQSMIPDIDYDWYLRAC